MMFQALRCPLAAVTIVVALAGQARAEPVAVNAFSDLVLWAGSGTNSAAFILQFSGTTETPKSVAWGYRWSGTATMQAMMNTIVGRTTLAGGAAVPSGLDGRLSVDGTQYPFGVFLSAIEYNQVGLPAGWSQVTREIVNNWTNDGTYPVLYTRAGAAGEWVTEPESTTMLFTYSEVGASDITLTSGGWYGFVQSNGANTFAFTQPVAAVPEPGTWALAGAAAAAAAGWRRDRRRRLVTQAAGRATRVPRA